eukprot:ANDGO_01554.mRNA.1 RING-type zinc-finger
MEGNSVLRQFVQQDCFYKLCVESIPESLQCPICMHLLVDAKLMSCCGNTVCDSCFRNITDTCAFCRTIVSQRTGVANRIVSELIDKLQVRCPWACGSQFALSEYTRHAAECVNVECECFYARFKCSWKGKKGDRDAHVATCAVAPFASLFDSMFSKISLLETEVRELRAEVRKQGAQLTAICAEEEEEQEEQEEQEQRQDGGQEETPLVARSPFDFAMWERPLNDTSALAPISMPNRFSEVEVPGNLVSRGTTLDSSWSTPVDSFRISMDGLGVTKTAMIPIPPAPISSHQDSTSFGLRTSHYDTIVAPYTMESGVHFIMYTVEALPAQHDMCLGVIDPNLVDIDEGFHAWTTVGGYIISSRDGKAWTAHCARLSYGTGPFSVGDRIVCVVDMERRLVGFRRNEIDLGVAYKFDNRVTSLVPIIELFGVGESARLCGCFECPLPPETPAASGVSTDAAP